LPHARFSPKLALTRSGQAEIEEPEPDRRAIMRRVGLISLLLLLLLPAGAAVADLPELALSISPPAPTTSDSITLAILSPINSEGIPQLWVGLSDVVEDSIAVDSGAIQIDTSYSAPPAGTIVLPAYKAFERTIELGQLTGGSYSLDYDLFGYESLLAAGSLSFTVLFDDSMPIVPAVPEPATTGMAAIAMMAAVGLLHRRSFRRFA
jgi:hypothetical protein